MTDQKNYFLLDTKVMFSRLMKHIFRNIDTIITICIMPIAIMLLMVYVFGGAFGADMTRAEYVKYSLPGILLISASSSVAYTSVRIFTDLKSGFFDRFKSMPISISAALWSHVLTSLISTFLSLLLIIIVAVLIGFRTSVGIMNWFAVSGIMIAFTLAITWIAVIAGLRASSAEGAGAFSYPLIFLPFISSAFLPTETMPVALQIFAKYQPVTTIVEAIRSLLTEESISNNIALSFGWCFLIIIIAYIFAIREYRKRV